MFQFADALILTDSALEPPAVAKRESASAAVPRYRIQLAIGLLVLALFFIPFSASFKSAGTQMDDGFLLVYPELILKGKVPYRDFETFYGPANPYLLAGIYSLTDFSLSAERALGLVYRFAIVGAIYALVVRRGIVLAAGCATLSGLLLLVTELDAYAWFGALTCVLLSFASIRTRSISGQIAGGFLAGGALLFRPDIGPAVFISVLPLLFFMNRRARLHYAAGFLVAMLPLLGISVVAGWRNVLDNLFLLPVFHTSSGRRLPILSVDQYLIVLLFAHFIAGVINVIAGGVAVKADRKNWDARLFLALALLALAVSHQPLQRLDNLHLLFAASLSLSLLPVSLVILLEKLWRAPLSITGTCLCLVSVLAAIEAIAPEIPFKMRREVTTGPFANRDQCVAISYGNRSFIVKPPEVARFATPLLDAIEHFSRPGERLFVGPADLRRSNYCDTWLYHMLPKLDPASYFVEMNPGSANRANSRLATDIASADWLILNRMWDVMFNEPNRSRDFASDEPNEVVRQKFTLVQRFGPFELFHRNP